MTETDSSGLPPTIIKKIYQIINRITDISPEEQGQDKDFITDIGLDSLQLLRIATAIEEELGIELPVTVFEISTLSGFFKILQEELVKQNALYDQ